MFGKPLEDIMIDLPTGTVAYAVLSFHHGFLNMSEKLFALPWEALTVDEENEQMILNVSKELITGPNKPSLVVRDVGSPSSPTLPPVTVAVFFFPNKFPNLDLLPFKSSAA
mgnify:CR=1 FL=1